MWDFKTGKDRETETDKDRKTHRPVDEERQTERLIGQETKTEKHIDR